AAIGGMFSERSGVVNIGLEGMMLMGAFWGVYGADKGGSWVVGILVGMGVGAVLALVYGFFAIHLRADQIVGGTAVNFLALGITGYFLFQLYNSDHVSNISSTIPDVNIPGIDSMHFLGPAIGHLNLMVWVGFALVIVSYFVVFKTPIGLRIRACGEHPRAADTVGINVYAVRYACVAVSGVLAALGGVYLSDGYGGGTFINNMTDGRGFIALAALALLAALAGVLAVPVAVVLSRQTGRIHLLDAVWAIPVGMALSVVALVFARGARGQIRKSLERAGGTGRVRATWWLAVAGI